MKITADENILFVKEAFSTIGEVELLPGREIENSNLKNTDVLLVRSVTLVNEELLRDTPVKFVGTATIGDDHVDKEYLNAEGIQFTNAKGCNAQAVAEYVFDSIIELAVRHKLSLKNPSIGVIGVGNIGSRVASYAETLGLNIIKNDPPLEELTGSNEYADLRAALNADIITLHVPMNMGGKFNTFHLLNDENIEVIKPGAILINASRGSVVDNEALLNRLKRNNDLFTVLDVWEAEPQVNLDLLQSVDIATAHVAGYSLEGKINGTEMIYDTLCRFLNVEKCWKPEYPVIKDDTIILEEREELEQLHKIFKHVYPIDEDSKKMKDSMLSSSTPEKVFDKLRNDYSFRRELHNYKLTGNINENILPFAEAMGMEIIS